MRALPGPRATGLLGLASIAAILGGALVAAIPYRGWAGESYSPLNHFISELGEIARSQASVAFNVGVIAGGLGLGLFLILLARRMTGRYRLVMAAAGLVADVSGTLVGVFPMDYHPIHGLVSAVFFCTGPGRGSISAAGCSLQRPSGSRPASLSWPSTRPTARCPRTSISWSAHRCGRCRSSNGLRW